MYDITVNCTYQENDSLDLYQQEVLRAFQINTYEDLLGEVEKLYETIEKTDAFMNLLTKVQESTGLPIDFSFFVLFSYDYFDKTHAYLSAKENAYEELYQSL